MKAKLEAINWAALVAKAEAEALKLGKAVLPVLLAFIREELGPLVPAMQAAGCRGCCPDDPDECDRQALCHLLQAAALLSGRCCG